MLSFDTNILVYAANRQAGDRHNAASRLMAEAISADTAINEQSIIEFLNVMTRKRQQPLSDAAEMVRAWLINFALITAPPSIVEDTLSLLSKYKLSIWDAHMLAICAGNGCDVLFSEDLKDGEVYDGVLVLNPFNPQNHPGMRKFFLT